MVDTLHQTVTPSATHLFLLFTVFRVMTTVDLNADTGGHPLGFPESVWTFYSIDLEPNLAAANATSHFDLRFTMIQGSRGGGRSDVALDDLRLDAKGGPVPTIASSSPTNNATGVSIELGSIDVVFSGPMNPDAVEGSMTLTCDGIAFDLAFEWSADLTEVALVVGRHLTPAAECQVAPGASATSISGVALADTFVFYTGGRTRDFGVTSAVPLGSAQVNVVKARARAWCVVRGGVCWR